MPLYTLVSSAAEGARVAGAVARDGGLREAGLALGVAGAHVIADVLAVAEVLLALRLDGVRVGRGVLDDRPGVQKRLRLVGARLLAVLDVRVDPVAAALDLGQVGLRRLLLLDGGLLQLLLALELQLRRAELLAEPGQLLAEAILLGGERGHAVLEGVLRRLLVVVRLHLLLVRLVQDELEHVDGLVAALARVGAVGLVLAGGPGVRGIRRRVLALALLHQGDRLVVGGEHLDGLLQEPLSLHEARDVLLVGAVLLRALRGLLLLVLVVLLQGDLVVGDLLLEALDRVVDLGLEVVDLAVEGGDLLLLLGHDIVVLLPLVEAELLLLLVRLGLLRDDVEHLADLLDHDGERVLGLDHGRDPGDPQGLRGLGREEL
mmetsp:Transcript_51033/g.111242  ORF Transcript_51033/g.111242 Transcript_51033/m.111242 type:complete len:375 (+) Transcript_51033:16-1140(+)